MSSSRYIGCARPVCLRRYLCFRGDKELFCRMFELGFLFYSNSSIGCDKKKRERREKLEHVGPRRRSGRLEHSRTDGSQRRPTYHVDDEEDDDGAPNSGNSSSFPNSEDERICPFIKHASFVLLDV